MKRIVVGFLAGLALVGVLWLALATPLELRETTLTRLGASLVGRHSAVDAHISSRAGTQIDDSEPLLGHGIIEAQDDVIISAEAGGRVAFLGAKLGDAVEANAKLVRLDDELVLAQIDQARAAVEVAQANVAYIKAAARPAEFDAACAAVDAASAQVEAAKTGLDVAAANLDVATAKVKAAQARDSKWVIGPSATDLELANKQVELARIQLWAAQAARDATRNGMNLPLRIPVVLQGTDLGTLEIPNPLSPKQADVEAAEAKIVEAESAIRLAELQVEKLKSGASSQELAVARAGVARAEADVKLAQLLRNQAQQAVRVAEAQMGQVKAQANLQLAGPRPDDIAIAEAKVVEAQAQAAILEAARSKLTLVTPIAGFITERLVHEGEVVVPGARLFTVSALDIVRLTVYIPEGQLGRVRLGQEVMVASEANPDQTLVGQVVHIANEAEFTPRNIQVEDERATTVFAVRIRVPNTDRRLRPGMTASAMFH
jgi:multidrug resistance efflux pump